ncbi:MAG: DPP IV N-terminal domain-containing protein, partial [Bacteroidaceae bacterium]|nr:DPP IV N-terminal domain-containing protein [Bacteroidaceae bacterium]
MPHKPHKPYKPYKPYKLYLLVALLAPLTLFAQGTPDDYKRAFAARQTFSWQQVKDYSDDVRWLPDGKFQYHLTDGVGGGGTWHFGQVTADGRVVLADTTSQHPVVLESTRNYGRHHGSFIANPSQRRQQRHWMEVGDEREAGPVLSPDSQLVAFVRNDNLWIAKPDGSEARALTWDGTLSNYFSSYIYWSPDGRYVAACKIRPVEKRYVYYVESSPSDQLQPVLHKQEYAKPGDELMQKVPYVVEVATGRVIKADESLIANQYSLSGPEWREDSKGIRFEYNQRGHKL